jgi:hypothetical protein
MYFSLKEFLSSISFNNSKNDIEKIIEINENSIDKISKYLINFHDNMLNRLKNTKNLVDKINFPDICNKVKL